MSNLTEAKHARVFAAVDLNKLSQDNLLSVEAGDAKGVTEEPLLATRSVVSAVHHEEAVFKKNYVELRQSLDNDLKSSRTECEDTARQLDERDAKV